MPGDYIEVEQEKTLDCAFTAKWQKLRKNLPHTISTNLAVLYMFSHKKQITPCSL